MENKREDLYSEDFRLLNKCMLENNLVIFVGAGLSIGSGYPSWNELVSAIKDRLGIIDETNTLIIPQLYYNSRGEKEYNELIHELLIKGNCVPNAAHDCLVQINPKYLITTNYDNLIEKAFSEKGIFLDVIERDIDLPYTHTDHVLIKMHGGFKFNNFVLKEDDYLNYSENFTLIENFIKSLFARFTVLFVGYSFNDPNTKQIVSWVRRVLNGNQQRAYLINIDKKYDSEMANYYKNIGLNILYANALYEEDDSTTKTVKILNRIIKPSTNLIAEINNSLKTYDIFNYISKDIIIKEFNKFCTCHDYNENLNIFCHDHNSYEALSSYFFTDDTDSNYCTKTIKDYPYILKALKKSSFNKVLISDLSKNNILAGSKEISILKDTLKDSKLIKCFEQFDYISIKSFLDTLFEEDIDKLSQKAYVHYYFNQYSLCYETLKRYANILLRNKQYVQYLLVENGRSVIGHLISENIFLPVSNAYRAKVKEEIKRLDSNSRSYNSSYRESLINQPLLDLLDFKMVYRLLYKTIQKGQKVDEQAHSEYSLFSGTPAYELMENVVKDIYCFLQHNYLFFDSYSETISIFTLFIDKLLLSISTSTNDENTDFIKDTSNIALSELSKFDIMIILRFVNYSDLKTIIGKYRINYLNISDEAYGYLSIVLSNLSLSYDILNNNNQFQVMNKIFLIASLLTKPEKIFIQCFELGKRLIVEYNHNVSYKEVNSFICNTFKEKPDLYKNAEISELLKDALNTMKSIKDIDYYFIRIVCNLSKIYYKISSENKIRFNETTQIVYSATFDIEILVNLYNIATNEFQEKIKDEVLRRLNKKMDCYSYYLSLDSNTIDATIELENKFFDCAIAIIEETKKGVEHRDSNNIPGYFANLLFQNKLINKARFETIITQDKSLCLLINPQKYSYLNFDPNVLKPLTPKALEILSKNKKAHSEIHKKLKLYLSSNWDEDLAKIYVEYFS